MSDVADAPGAGTSDEEGRTDAERRETDLGTSVITLVALAAVGLGVADAASVHAVAGPLGAVAVVAGTVLVSSRRLSRRAVGSCGVVVGLVVAGVASVRGGSLVVAVGVAATAATGFALVPRTYRHGPMRRALVDSAVSTTGGGILAAILFVLGIVAADVVRSGSSPALADPFAAALALQLLVLAAVALVAAADATIERWRTGADVDSTRSLVERLDSVPSGVYYALAAQLLGWLVFDLGWAFESALSALGPVGLVVSRAVTSGLLHGVVLLVCLGATAVLAADWFRPLVTGWLEPVPVRTLALAAGGPVTAVALAGWAAVAGIAVDSWTSLTILTVLGAAALLAAGVIPSNDVETPMASRWRSVGLRVGAAGLFVATLLAAVGGLHPIGVFAGVGLALFVWDVGGTVLSLRRQAGPRADTREPELVRAAASVLIGCGGVAVATAALYVVGGASPPSERWQAVAPVALALGSIVLAAMALERWSPVRSIRGRVDVDRGTVVAWARSHPRIVAVGVVLAVALPLLPPSAAFLVFLAALFVAMAAAVEPRTSTR